MCIRDRDNKALKEIGFNKDVKKIVQHLEGMAKHYGEGFKRYEKGFNLLTRNAGKGKLENMTVRDAESLLKKHKSLTSSKSL